MESTTITHRFEPWPSTN